MSAPGFKEYSLDDVPFLLTEEGKVGGSDVTLAGGQASTLDPTSRIPPGTVIVKETADEKFYFADDAANGDRNGAASLQSAEPVDAAWDGQTLTFLVNGREIQVPLAAGDDTTSEAVTTLQANAAFTAHLAASGLDGNPLVITSLEKGAHVAISASSPFDAAGAGFGAGGADAIGSDADYRVTNRFGSLKDLKDADVDDVVGTYLAGHFKKSLLSNLTAEAEAVFNRRGSRFE